MEEITATITLTLQDIQILNDIISTSQPRTAFGTVTQLVSKINKQLQEQLQKVEQS